MARLSELCGWTRPYCPTLWGHAPADDPGHDYVAGGAGAHPRDAAQISTGVLESGSRSETAPDHWNALVSIPTPAIVVGYSMGARLALAHALARPSSVSALVLLGANPGLESQRERHARVQKERTWLSRLNHEGVAAFVRWWTALPMFSAIPEDRRFVHERGLLDRCGLADAISAFSLSSQPNLWLRLPEISLPTLWLAGAGDDRFAAIARRAADMSRSDFALIEAAGHAAHLERPEAFATLVGRWLAAL